MDKAEFRKNLKKVIVGAGYTPNEIATYLRISKSTVRRWAAGTSYPHEFMRAGIIRSLAYMILDRGVR